MLSTGGLRAGHGGFIFHVQKTAIYAHVVRARLPRMGRASSGFRLSPADRSNCSRSMQGRLNTVNVPIFGHFERKAKTCSVQALGLRTLVSAGV